ncbi:MAG: chromosome segregation protein SMC [Gomphosphaeria aponina SAG 52.96 = DSM 107014]|uniref:Chromosome partition protein Smc n=1 Tax=Gomphosphaeria aponina SAG 52.96 = DSM 107014 TaxID=1521640 RepID=A0A941GRK3_9CHRO|nr:chromosome segregation protein SMC [Gomphosphaeria aponina SAG 52.96 = DSM 107014]
MVHIKRVELSNFKSFGGTTKIPLLPGFTVVSGPNGSGKSNILDALLFCLGLASSKGMRAERLPDLVNHNQAKNGRSAETSVSVTFHLGDLDDLEEITPPDSSGEITPPNPPLLRGGENTPADSSEEITPPEHLLRGGDTSKQGEWTVTRRLRVSKGGNYSSTYYINGEVCTANELHAQLNRLRIYPEGYNVVLQGDVTSIISMNSKERREIIDELAGVAEFDRKIEQARKTLDTVKEKEERSLIIEKELINARDRLAADRIKAQKYQELKSQIHEKQQWEVVLIWRSLQQQQQQLSAQITAAEAEETNLTEQLNSLNTQITQATDSLKQLNTKIKSLGEDEQLSVASQLATQKAKRYQLQQRQTELENLTQQTNTAISTTQKEIEQHYHTITQLTQEKNYLETEIIPNLTHQRNQVRISLEEKKEKAQAIAAASDAWVQQQTALSHKIADLQKILNPQRTQQARLTEAQNQSIKKITEQTQLLQTTATELTTKEENLAHLSTQFTTSQQLIQTLAQQLTAAEAEQTMQQETITRLLKEQREKQRQLDKLEATKQAQQEAQGTYATKIILQSNLPGVCGLVCQLGQVEPSYQLALEIAAGGRLGHIVVENDQVAASGIELLKQQRAGRATFLPLNKIKAPRFNDTVALRYAKGFVNLAVNLVDCDPRYQQIFAYVFGSTVVFATLNDARPFLGDHRIVTLDGELLESSGAMTGGSVANRSSLRFGVRSEEDSEEIQTLKRRLAEIETVLTPSEIALAQNKANVKGWSEKLTEARQLGRENQLRKEQLEQEIGRLTREKVQLTAQLGENNQELEITAQRLVVLGQEIPELEIQLQEEQEKLAELEASQTHSEWQEIAKLIKTEEVQLQERERALRQAEEKLKDIANQLLREEEKRQQANEGLKEGEQKLIEVEEQQGIIGEELLVLEEKIRETEGELEKLSAKLGETKQERDRAEESLKKLQNQQQKKIWQLQKLQENQQERREELGNLQQKLEEQKAELPDPLPEIPQLIATEGETITFSNFAEQLEQLQKEIRNGQKRLEAMEPVNMLALEEYERTQARLEELTEKLTTLKAERTELLLRVENFTTLRFRAFKEAFDAVNENFQSIFATLSEGDGYLQLDDTENPFNGGLNLVAHPKGKPVQRLSSMSGGEKSLTALSFIFALQKYRPSPFYAFDEVDMFLDGANVERLSKMISLQAEEAQFIVVSLRRPMIESAERTIGVTQARGAYTQVLGIKLR